jgi:hypothetical protein
MQRASSLCANNPSICYNHDSAEYPAATNYLYMTYAGYEHDVVPSSDGVAAAADRWMHDGDAYRKEKGLQTGAASAVMVLGCGAYRIGSSCGESILLLELKFPEFCTLSYSQT